MKSEELKRYLETGRIPEHADSERAGGYLVPETSTIYHKKETMFAEMCYANYTLWEFISTVFKELADGAERKGRRSWKLAHREEKVDTVGMFHKIIALERKLE